MYDIQESKHNSFLMYQFLGYPNKEASNQYLKLFVSDMLSFKVLTLFHNTAIYNFRFYYNNVLLTNINPSNLEVCNDFTKMQDFRSC